MEFEKLLAYPAYRRGWLLLKALECAPLDQAIDLARAADLFVIGNDRGDAASVIAAADCSAVPHTLRPRGTIKQHAPPAPAESSRVNLSCAQRAELLGRIAKGATNTEVAAEFGLRPRQVQGIRMGTARATARKMIS